jgi:hypothetical protein
MLTTSGAQTVEDCEQAYADSEQETWGQPPASCYFFDVVGATLYGQLTAGGQVSGSHSGATEEAFHAANESEDHLLVTYGALDRLVSLALKESPSDDWEHELSDL